MKAFGKVKKGTVLVVSSDVQELEVKRGDLAKKGFKVILASNGLEAERMIARGGLASVVISSRVPRDTTADKLIAWVRTRQPGLPVQVLGDESVVCSSAAKAADGVIPRQVSIVRWVEAGIAAFAERFAPPAPREDLAPPAKTPVEEGAPVLIGQSGAMLDLWGDITLAARMKRSLITGESGVGKEQVALTIHHCAKRSGAMVKINGAQVDKELATDIFMGHEKGAHSGAFGVHRGLFEQAHRGTLFIDEVADVISEVQVKLLRVLDVGKVRRQLGSEDIDVDVMVLVATNKDLQAEMQAGRFRRDLYYRLAEYKVRVPPLRDRTEDIEEIAQYFVGVKCVELGIQPKRLTKGAAELLKVAEYPGNVRDLRSLVWRATAKSDEGTALVTREDVKAAMQNNEKADVDPQGVKRKGTMEARVRRVMQEALAEALRATKHNRRAAADLLNMPRSSFYRALAEVGLQVREPEGDPEDP